MPARRSNAPDSECRCAGEWRRRRNLFGRRLGRRTPAASAPGSASAPRLRGEYITRRAFLRTGQAGEQGFGLYSYFLMREPASPSEQSRAAAFVAAFLDVLVGVADQENYVERRRLNGSYMPMTMDPPQGLAAEQRAAWALEHYDYEHAKAFLSLYPTLSGTGPFIVAVPAPLRIAGEADAALGFQPDRRRRDAAGVGRFLNQAAQLYDWQNQDALQKLRRAAAHRGRRHVRRPGRGGELDAIVR